jgi:hypothetical protein
LRFQKDAVVGNPRLFGHGVSSSATCLSTGFVFVISGQVARRLQRAMVGYAVPMYPRTNESERTKGGGSGSLSSLPQSPKYRNRRRLRVPFRWRRTR